MQQFYEEWDVWPAESPVEQYTPIVREPDEVIFMDQGGDPIPSRDELEAAYIQEYEEHGTLAFRSESQKQFIEWRKGLNPT